ncbi:DUF3597 domain-containing protein [Pseudomonas cremoricolorata]|uniref:DUF3597 domain-containing protein n=1 Tax=Pseudomonas cremoricolorata TaxID=157783 RepID=A0A089WWT6_9PSED|nr:DUF3597 domain-containing protein [Pseudomonas cremoricolorata]AIR91077.1 hypothetical protein LK03_18180 [Pseudomonas cremoricolorata]
MSLFRSILEKLGIGQHDAPKADAAPSAPPAGGASAPNSPAPGAAPAAVSEVDVAQKLESLATQHSEPLNWRTSIVDLLKLLGLDSSLTARKELASELGYSGSTDDSAAMNTWLHAQVMKKLAENGGKVPAELLH